MSLRKVVLVPFDQFKTLISNSTQNSLGGTDSDIKDQSKISSSEPIIHNKEENKSVTDKNSPEKDRENGTKTSAKKGKEKLRINSRKKVTSRIETPLKIRKKRKVEGIVGNTLTRPPPGLPNQIGGASSRKLELFNFSSPIEEGKRDLSRAIAKFWIE